MFKDENAKAEAGLSQLLSDITTIADFLSFNLVLTQPS